MEKINNSIEVVENFFSAINKVDFEEAKTYMSENHHYSGPMFSTNNPEDYFEKLKAFEMEFAVETQDMLVAGNGVTHRSILKVLSPVQANIPCCEVFIVDKNKITHQYFYFDTALFPKS